MSLAAVRLTVLALTGFAVGAVTALAVLPEARRRLLPDAPGANVNVSGEALIGGPFALTDHTGHAVTDADFRGRTMLVAFGSTTAADATAPTVQVMLAALERLGPKAERVVPVLIAVDDVSPERLQRFVAGFSPRLVGLAGTARQVADVLAAYRVPGIGKSEDGALPGRYTVDFPPPIYIMGPDGRYRGHLSFAAGADAVAASLAGML